MLWLNSHRRVDETKYLVRMRQLETVQVPLGTARSLMVYRNAGERVLLLKLMHIYGFKIPGWMPIGRVAVNCPVPAGSAWSPFSVTSNELSLPKRWKQ